VPFGGFFGALFAALGPFFNKNVSFYSIIEGNGAVFESFEKEGGVIALSG